MKSQEASFCLITRGVFCKHRLQRPCCPRLITATLKPMAKIPLTSPRPTVLCCYHVLKCYVPLTHNPAKEQKKMLILIANEAENKRENVE